MRSVSSVFNPCGGFLRPLFNQGKLARNAEQLIVPLLTIVVLTATPFTRSFAVDSDKETERSVVAFLAAHCKKCHGATKKEGRLTLQNINTDLASGQDLDRWQAVLERLDAGEMPPRTERRPAAAEVQHVLGWVRAGLKKAEAAGHIINRTRKPGQGNAVKHSLLFDPRYEAVSIPAASRAWRL